MGKPGVAELRTLVAEHYTAVYRYAFRLCGNSPDAEDVTQQTFLRAQRAIDQLRDAERADRWLLKIARNEFLRRRSMAAPGSLADDSVTGPPAHPSAALDDETEEVQRALRGLSDEYRLPVLLFYFEDLSYREIAAELEIPIGTVMSRLSRARMHLREQLLRQERPHLGPEAQAAVRFPPPPPIPPGS